MRGLWTTVMAWVISAAAATAQAAGGATERPAGAPAGDGAAATAPAVPKLSAEARAAIAAARELAKKARSLEGAEKLAALQAAATAFDKVATDFAAESAAVAQAAYEGADAWKRHGSSAEAEHDFLVAAQQDPPRYAQRGKIGAADMQRRLDRASEALATYAEAVAVDPTTTRAQGARIWQGRILQSLGRGADAIAMFRTAVAAARTPQQVIEASNYLAKVQVDQGELDAAAQSIAHAESAVAAAGTADPIAQERLQKALASMSARRALQRLRDKKADATGDAVQLEASRRAGS